MGGRVVGNCGQLGRNSDICMSVCVCTCTCVTQKGERGDEEDLELCERMSDGD